MAQTPTRTPPVEYGATQPRRPDWVKYAMLVAAVVLLVVGVLLLRPRTDAAPAPAPPTATTTRLTVEQQAKADTEPVLRAWIANYAKAFTSFDATQLDSTLATPQVIAAAKADMDNLRPAAAAAAGVTGRYTADIRAVEIIPYTAERVSLNVCALRDVRFIKDGTDVTVTRDRQPAPLATQPLWQTTEFTKTGAGGSWQVSAFELDPQVGPPC